MLNWKAESSYKHHSNRFMKQLMLRRNVKVQLYQERAFGSC
jgi:hypothetical protein